MFSPYNYDKLWNPCASTNSRAGINTAHIKVIEAPNDEEMKIEWCMESCDSETDCSAFEWNNHVKDEDDDTEPIQKCKIMITGWDDGDYVTVASTE